MAQAKQIDFLLAGVRNPETDEPLTGGAVYCYQAGTTTPINLYTSRDIDGENQAPNPVILDAEGKAEVFGNGVYKFIIRDQADESAEIVMEVDGVEYTAVVSESGGVGPLVEDLDAAGFRMINMGAGTEAGDAVEWQQWQNNIDALEAATAAVQTNLNNKTFVSLTDTPASFSGAGLKLVRVNTGATALEFVDQASAVSKSFLQLTDTPDAYTSQAGKAVLVNSGESAVEFGYPDAKTIQGKGVDTTAPTNGQILVYNSTSGKYEPTTPSATGSLVRTSVFSGSSTSVAIASPTDYPGTALYFHVQFDAAGDMVAMMDAAATSSLGYYRVVNRGGENADRNYDMLLYVSKGSGDSYTFSGRLIKRVIVYSQI